MEGERREEEEEEEAEEEEKGRGRGGGGEESPKYERNKRMGEARCVYACISRSTSLCLLTNKSIFISR